MTSRVDSVVADVRSGITDMMSEALLISVHKRFVNIIGSGKRKVKEPETS
jgi:hypothetical protein